MKKIFLCASMAFYKELVQIEKQLEEKGFAVTIPVSAQIMKQKNDFNVLHFKNALTPQQKGKHIMTNFREIEKVDSILVINNQKNGVNGYIGAKVLMEIGLAFFLGKKTYIWNPTETTAACNEELFAFGAVFINHDINKIT